MLCDYPNLRIQKKLLWTQRSAMYSSKYLNGCQPTYLIYCLRFLCIYIINVFTTQVVEAIIIVSRTDTQKLLYFFGRQLNILEAAQSSFAPYLQEKQTKVCLHPELDKVQQLQSMIDLMLFFCSKIRLQLFVCVQLFKNSLPSSLQGHGRTAQFP